MLPEFPAATDSIKKAWLQILSKNFDFSDPLISQVSVRIYHEGNKSSFNGDEGNYQRQSSSYQWIPENGSGIPTEEFFALPARMGKEMATQSAQGIIGAMSKPSPISGVFDTQEEPITFEMWLEKMKGYQLPFDDNGKPRWPQLFLFDNSGESVAQMMKNAFSDESKIPLIRELIAQKKIEFDERENYRRLAD